jgi:hypothetical protein
MSCTSADLDRLADRVRRYWGSHLHVKVGGPGAPHMDWQTVRVSPDFTDWSEPHLLAILLHEWGHRMLSPVSPERGAVWRKAAEKEGLTKAQAHTVVNIATDGWIDRFYLTSPDWAPTYWRGEVESVRELFETDRNSANHNDAPSLRQVLLQFYVRLLRDTVPANEELKAPEHLHPLSDTVPGVEAEVTERADALWRILYEEGYEEPHAIRSVARLLRDLLPEDLASLLSPLHPFNPRTDAKLTPSLRRAARRAGLTGADLRTLFGGETVDDLRRRTERLDLYERIVPIVERFFRRTSAARREGYRMWDVGQPLRELDLLATLERSGALLPGVTTLARQYQPSGSESNRGAGRVVLVIDDSASTAGDALTREKEAAFAVIAAARKIRDPVGVVVFGSSVTHSIAPTSRYGRLEETIAQLSASSGGTSLHPALTEALDHLAGAQKGALMIMTDAAFHDEQAVRDRLSHLPTGVVPVAFCFGAEDTAHQKFAPVSNRRLQVFSASPDESFTERALNQLYGSTP